MLLNKLPVLDKGYVALISSSNNGEVLKNIQGLANIPLSELAAISSLTLAIKAPLFVQLYLSKFKLNIWNILQEKIEAFIPDITDVNCTEHALGTTIADDIARTTAALLLNPKSYQKDGCDRFISQVITPISVYNELIIYGSLEQWVRFSESEGLPNSIQQYANAVKDIIRNEWKYGEKETTKKDSVL